MGIFSWALITFTFLSINYCEGAKINTPRVLIPWFENTSVNFTFEIIDGGCYTWSLSRDDIIDLEPIYEDSWGHCSRAARVARAKTCSPPGSVIILAEEVNTGEILRGDVDIDIITSLKVMSTTWRLYLEEAPEAFEVHAYDALGNRFSTLEGLKFDWSIRNLGNIAEEDPIVSLVQWRDTAYEAPKGVTEQEESGQHSYSVLLYGKAMGEAQVSVCLERVCSEITLNVVASVVLTPATAIIAPGDTLRYKVVRARSGRLTVQDVGDTLYNMQVPDSRIASLDDTVSLIRGHVVGSTSVLLLSGGTEVASATLYVTEPYSIRVTLRPSSLLVRGEEFLIHCAALDSFGHPLTAGDETLFRLTVEGAARVELLHSTVNGTHTDAVAHAIGPFTVSARLHSVAGRVLSNRVEGQASSIVVDPLQVVPPELYIAWTDSFQEMQLRHRGGGEEQVVWSALEEDDVNGALAVTAEGLLKVRGVSQVGVRVQLKQHPHVRATGRVWVLKPDLLRLSSSGVARVGRPHFLHVGLTATHPATGELFNFHRCDCATFAVALLEGPEPHNVTAAPAVDPIEGACCVLSCEWRDRGVASLRVSRGRTGDTARVAVRSAPQLVWPESAAALVGATLPILTLGEVLIPSSLDPRTADLVLRDGPPPHRYPDVQLFTLKCKRKGDTAVSLLSNTDDESESVQLDVVCASHVTRIRLEPPESPGNCTGGTKVWLQPGVEAGIRVALLDSAGRELLDEKGPKVAWTITPAHSAIEYRSLDRLLVETHPQYSPVPVPNKYYQGVSASEAAAGWSGVLRASAGDATATIHARVVGPLRCEPTRLNIAWEGESVSKLSSVTGGSGRYAVEGPSGVSAAVESGQLGAVLPGPGTYDLYVSDLCVPDQKALVEVSIEEVSSVEVSTSRAVCVGACIPISALVRGLSERYLTTSQLPEWRTAGTVEIRDGALCGVKEGPGRVRAAIAGVWSPELEVVVFPPLSIVPARTRLPPGARIQLSHAGGPPPHLATLHYEPTDPYTTIGVSSSGAVTGMSVGAGRVRLTAQDVAGMEMARAECEVEVVAVSGVKARSATHSLLVGEPSTLWLEAEGDLGPAVLAALQPPPRTTWNLRDPSSARLYSTHIDDLLERATAEGLSVRVVPLKAGLITVDVRVRNIAQGGETRSWDSSIEIMGVSELRTSVEGLPGTLNSGERLALAVGASIKLRTAPRAAWRSSDDGVVELSSNGDLKALKPGSTVIIAQHKDDRNNIYREAAVHVEVAQPHYCTVEPASEEETVVRLAVRSALGRRLLAPDAVLSAHAPLIAHSRRSAHSTLGNELLLTGLDFSGTFATVEGSVSGVTLQDHVWIIGSDSGLDRVVAGSGWAVCLEGGSWRAPPNVGLAEGAGVTLAVLNKDGSGRHVLKADRPSRSVTIQQLPLTKMEFMPGEWPSSLVPLALEASGLGGGPLLCTEEQRQALDGVLLSLPFQCHTQAPHTARAEVDLINGHIGCSITPAATVTDASEVELCAEWGPARTCTRTFLLPPVRVLPTAVTLADQQSTLTIYGHPHALRTTRVTASPGLKLQTNIKNEGEIIVTVRSDSNSCGAGWVMVRSRLTAQEIRVVAKRECDEACGSLLGAAFTLLQPYLATVVTSAVIVLTAFYFYAKLLEKLAKGPIKLPPQTSVLPESAPQSPPRTWSRSPYATHASSSPVYGDTSVLPTDSSFSPHSPRTHSRFL